MKKIQSVKGKMMSEKDKLVLGHSKFRLHKEQKTSIRRSNLTMKVFVFKGPDETVSARIVVMAKGKDQALELAREELTNSGVSARYIDNLEVEMVYEPFELRKPIVLFSAFD